MTVASLISGASYLSFILGLCATGIYIAIFYMTPTNELYFYGQSGYDETDLPYTLAMVECFITASVFIIGTLAFRNSSTSKTLTENQKGAVLTASAFFVIAFIIQGTIGTVRAYNLGLISEDATQTCSDKGLSGCPTTRYEAAHQDITFSSPFGGQCSFWFWGPAMKARYEQDDDACGGWADGQLGACLGESHTCDQWIAEKMDWTKPSSYGYHDDTSDLASLLRDSSGANTMKKVHNMEQLFKIQSCLNASSYPIAAAYTYSRQPTVSYCWYWGCSEVCTSQRFWINRVWLYVSLTSTVFHFVNIILCFAIYKHQTVKASAEASLLANDQIFGKSLDIEVPAVGRRRRIQNPSGLLF